ncbi:MAG TPA: S8 family serine peptidase, partial [Caldilineaceae bacterium]|nr:S8 family serine peptidase [Caldilineaceae bacterium]
DLTSAARWPGPAPLWTRLTFGELRAVLEKVDLRLAGYVDLTGGACEEGLTLPSLWDGAGYSWHGQMTTTLAAGNGLLSDGHFRGYAPYAHLLPIKIGQANGRIPESDILAGLRWLLDQERWLRYNIRVVNIAVGGDFDQPWFENPVCLAAEELSKRGVLVCAAAGNSGRNVLFAPAGSPSVLTVGGYEDGNRRWDPQAPAQVAELALYHHNYGRSFAQGEWQQKPEILALARWLPAPILPPSPLFQELYTITALRRVLLDNRPSFVPHPAEDGLVDEWMFEVWEAVRKRMNAHKWVHSHYQHVDGTSVAVAQVAGVAAQMFEANPNLSGQAVKQLLLSTALALPDKPANLVGHGILQPTVAGATALRTGGGNLRNFPHSGTQPMASELQNWLRQGTVDRADLLNSAGVDSWQPVYFGCYAPQVQTVSLVGSFNNWQPSQLLLRLAANGWWHGIVHLPPGRHAYRFWLDTPAAPTPRWQPDPENPRRSEGGYVEDHSLVSVAPVAG